LKVAETNTHTLKIKFCYITDSSALANQLQVIFGGGTLSFLRAFDWTKTCVMQD